MKYYIKNMALPMLAMAGLLTTSCELTEDNPAAGDATLRTYEIWAGLQAYSYSPISAQLYGSSDWVFASEGGTDLWQSAGNNNYAQEVMNYEQFSPSTNTTTKLWNQCYAMISNCNTVIEQAAEVQGGNQANIDILVAETKALRAFYNFLLVSNFGPVTLNMGQSSAFTGDLDLYPTRTAENVFYDQIEKDLKEAIPALQTEPFQGNRARMSKKSAMGLLARVYAQRAGLGDKYGDAEKYWKLAAETAEEMITNASTYGAYLYTDIADMWSDANNRTNREALFVAPGADANDEAYSIDFNTCTLFKYTMSDFYRDLYAHDPNKNGNYFYGRVNNVAWVPSQYLLYAFNPEWDRRWEYSFMFAGSDFSMVQTSPSDPKGQWVTYPKGQKTLSEANCDLYGIDKSHVGDVIYPYADCGYVSSAGGHNQYLPKIWPKGDHSGDAGVLLSIPSNGSQVGQPGYSGTTKAMAIPYPVTPDDDRFNTLFVHEPMSAADKAKCRYVVVCMKDLFGSNNMPYGNTANGSEASNPPAIGNGQVRADAFPSLIKFIWSAEGCFGKDLQRRNGDIYIMRMAEVYLIAAEARQMLGDGAKAAEHLNVLRQRAARKNAPESEWKLSTATEEDIFDEYARELCGEYNRWGLLKRHHAFETRLAKYNPRAAKSFKKEYYNRPVASSFLQVILNANEYGDNGYGQTPNSGLQGF